jgi:tetratricopeptide (TPR) repeat protein
MNNPFFISEEHLVSLRATRQGRISLGGFNYQAGFAISRMAAMIVRRHSLNLDGIPTALRYDWGEDLDERCRDSIVYFNQCKRVSDIGRPVSMAGVLLGFAPKLLWASVDNRTHVRFRLVCTDQRFSTGGRLSNSISDSRDAVRSHFLERLSNSPNDRSDRAIWQDAADAFGHEALFDALWDQTEAVFLSDAVHHDHPAGPILEAEREALRVLLESPEIGIAVERQRDTIARLRSVLYENLIEFNPTSNEIVDLGGRTPRQLRREDVASELFEYRHHEGERLPFQIVSRMFLQDQRAKAKREFVARPPEWSDVVHGTDDTVKFVERDQTEDLRQAVMDELIETVHRGTDQRLPVKFVVGPPGSGKSTIVRRVVATIVQEGHVIAADPGVYVENPSDPARLCDKLDMLARQGKPVLLVLDDPLYADSNWPDVLRKLATPRGEIAVLVASPTFLYERYKSKLRGRIHKTKFHITPPSDAEHRELDRLYKYTSSESAQAGDDFLALVMQRAAGDSFDGIIYRLWETLNNGRPISPDAVFEEYPWAVRAFLMTCFFHRTYVPCPEPILRAVLERSGGIASGRTVTDALQQLTYQDGWAVFRLKAPQVHPSFSFVGNQVSAAHHRIAERAWQLRPAPWRTLNHLIVQATFDAPEGIRAVGNAAAALGQAGDDGLANELVDAWKSTEVETRFVYDVYVTLHRAGCPAKLVGSLKARAVETRDGWMAALGLWYGSASVDHKREFPPTVNVISLIGAADFSIAPGRASRFANCLQSSEVAAFRKRLFECLDGKFNWTLESSLLTWLLANSPIAETRAYYSKITDWLDKHPEDTSVRTQYLTYLMKLPGKEFESERRQAAENTAQWLDEHRDDTNVRTAWLAFMLRKNTDTPHLWDQAEQNCLKLISLLPNSAPGYNAYGRFLMESERFSEALLQFTKALKIHKGFHMARWGLASAFWKSGEYQKAECEFKTALSWAQKNDASKVPMIKSSLGWLYIDCGQWQDAMAAFESARKLDPQYFGNLWGIGRVHFELGDFQKAADILRQSLNIPNLQPPASDEIPALLEKCLTQFEEQG